jgi:hypothetical protein
MRFGTRNIWSLDRPGTLTTISRELSRYGLDLVGGQWHHTSRSLTLRENGAEENIWIEEGIIDGRVGKTA